MCSRYSRLFTKTCLPWVPVPITYNIYTSLHCTDTWLSRQGGLGSIIYFHEDIHISHPPSPRASKCDYQEQDVEGYEILLYWLIINSLGTYSCLMVILLSGAWILTLTLPSPSAGVSGSLDSYCSLKPLCSGMVEEVPARTSPTLLPPSPRTVLSLSCFKVLQCINCRDWHCKS